MLCEQNLRADWSRIETVRAEIDPILQTHTHTRVSFSSIDVRVRSAMFSGNIRRTTSNTFVSMGEHLLIR